MRVDILKVQKGDIVKFSKYHLRVEEEPRRGKGSIVLQGRINIDGSPLVTKNFLGGRMVEIERGEA